MPEFVGADALGFDALTSRVKRDAAVLEMQCLCADKVQQVLMPLLEEAIALALGAAPTGKWLVYELDVDAKSPIIYFRYPVSQSQGFDYVRREVKLEMGTLTDQQPTGRYPIVPLVANVFARGWARYDLARHGSFRLVPPAARQADLARDYATMRPMFMTEPPRFEVLLQALRSAESAITS